MALETEIALDAAPVNDPSDQAAPAPFRKTRIIQHKTGYDPDAAPLPEIHLTGQYLARAGFGVGRHIDIIVEKDKITIVPTDPNSPVFDAMRIKKVMEGRAQMRAILQKLMDLDPDQGDAAVAEMQQKCEKRKRKKSGNKDHPEHGPT